MAHARFFPIGMLVLDLCFVDSGDIGLDTLPSKSDTFTFFTLNGPKQDQKNDMDIASTFQKMFAFLISV